MDCEPGKGSALFNDSMTGLDASDENISNNGKHRNSFEAIIAKFNSKSIHQ